MDEREIDKRDDAIRLERVAQLAEFERCASARWDATATATDHKWCEIHRDVKELILFGWEVALADQPNSNEGLEEAITWLRRNANAEKDPAKRSAFIEAHNAVRTLKK